MTQNARATKTDYATDTCLQIAFRPFREWFSPKATSKTSFEGYHYKQAQAFLTCPIFVFVNKS